MALEGARQMAQKGRRIKGYQIKDATFSSPISISPTGTKTETQLYMRPLHNTYEKVTPSFQFRICTLDDREWNEACQGMIYIHYDGIQSEVDAGREGSEKSWQIKRQYEKAIRTCNESVETKRMSQIFNDIGLAYGPAFQRLQNLAWDGGEEAIGEIRTPHWSEPYFQGHIQPHVIHPATLDAAAQLMWVSLTEGATILIPTGVPTRMRSAWISSTGLGYPDSTTLRAYSRSSFKGLRGTDSSMFAIDQAGDLKISISGMETTNISSHDASFQESSSVRNFCYSKDWKPDVSLMTTQQILAYCEVEKIDVPEPTEFFRDLELLLATYISRTLRQVSQAEVESLKPHMKKYYAWMKMQHAKPPMDRMFADEADRMLKFDDAQLSEELADRLETANAQGKLYVTVGRELPSLLRGTADSLGLLFQNGVAEAFYQDLFESAACCRKIRPYLDCLAHKNPAMRILEIGAGTGAMTGHILAPLRLHGESERGAARFARYDYTDISETFFESAREKFAGEIQGIHFRALNIENAPTDQGFEEGSYDLIIASSVSIAFAQDVLLLTLDRYYTQRRT